jgi:O-antigen/teichoic acid export membrane protein
VTLAMETTREALRAGRTLFAGTGAIAFYTGANAFLLGLLVPAGQVATFAAAEKTVRAGNRVLGLMSSAVYPRVSSLLDAGRVQRANRLLSLSLLTFGGAALASAVVVAAAAPVIVDVIFGSRFHDAVPLLRILSLLLPLNVIGVTLSTQWLLPRGRDRAVAAVLLVACVLNAALVVLTARTLGLTATAWAVVLVELVVMLGYLRVVRRGEGRSGPSSVRPVARGGSTG